MDYFRKIAQASCLFLLLHLLVCTIPSAQAQDSVPLPSDDSAGTEPDATLFGDNSDVNLDEGPIREDGGGQPDTTPTDDLDTPVSDAPPFFPEDGAETSTEVADTPVFNNTGGNSQNPSNSNGASGATGGGGGSRPSGSGSNPSGGGSGFAGDQYNDNDLINDFTLNDEWIKGSVPRLKNNVKLTVELANRGLNQLKKEEIKQPEISDEALQKGQELIDELLKRDIKERHNTTVNISAWPRVTYESINLESAEFFDGTCHVPFRDVFSSDIKEHYKYFSSPLVSLSRTLMDLPRVKLETMRQKYCEGTSCGGGGGGGEAGILRCFRTNKAYGMTTANLLDPVIEKLKANGQLNSDPQLNYLKQLELIPGLGAQVDPNPPICVAFAGKRFPWTAYSPQFLQSYRHILALQQGQDAYEYFQYLSSSSGQGKGESAAALKIGQSINNNDRFFGMRGNLALEVAPGFGETCPTIEDMTEFMRKGTPRGGLAFENANKLDPVYPEDPQKDSRCKEGECALRTSEYQAFTRYAVFKCGGGRHFRGKTLIADSSNLLCQTDSKAKPYSGRIQKFFQFEFPTIPPKETLIPWGQTKVC